MTAAAIAEEVRAARAKVQGEDRPDSIVVVINRENDKDTFYAFYLEAIKNINKSRIDIHEGVILAIASASPAEGGSLTVGKVVNAMISVVMNRTGPYFRKHFEGGSISGGSGTSKPGLALDAVWLYATVIRR